MRNVQLSDWLSKKRNALVRMCSSGSLRKFVSSVGSIDEPVDFPVGDGVDDLASSRVIVLESFPSVNIVIEDHIHLALIKFLN